MPSGTVVIAHGPAPASLARMGLRFALSHAAVRQYVQPVQRKGRAAGHQAVPCALRIGPEVSLRTSHIYPSRCDAGQQQVLVHRQGGGVRSIFLIFCAEPVGKQSIDGFQCLAAVFPRETGACVPGIVGNHKRDMFIVGSCPHRRLAQA